MRELGSVANLLFVRYIGPLGLLCFVTLYSPHVATAAQVAADRAAANLEKQRQSILRQMGGQKPGSFYVTPWQTESTALIRADCEPIAEERLRELTAFAATRFNLRADLIRAVIRRESGGRPCAVSNKGAQGLMQLMPATQQTMKVADPLDPEANIAGGAQYLSDLLKRYNGDLRRTLAAYNAGPQRVEPGGDLPDIPETRAYVAAIMADLQQTPGP